ncbi:MAG: Fic family protein [Solirubrobacterales bacterium]
MARAKSFQNRWFDEEVFRPEDHQNAARAARRGELRRISKGVYTANTAEPIERVVRRNWLEVAGLWFPGAVISGRSAVLARPTDDGVLFIDAGPGYSTNRTVDVHGLRLSAIRGPGPLPGDMPLKRMYISGQARIALENCRPSRRRGTGTRTLSREELEDWLDRIAARQGSDELDRIRNQARSLARRVGGDWLRWFETLDGLIGALRDTSEVALQTPAGIARGRGRAFDVARLEQFDRLRTELLAYRPLDSPEVDDPNQIFAFFEAYFSNFIEGTEFTVGEAERIVFDGRIPGDRPADAHDVLSTFKLAVDPAWRIATPSSADELIALARRINARVLHERPEKRLGEFKEVANRAGATTFVAPELVAGTLHQGWRFYESLPEGFARAVFVKYLIAEVHPFADGNGRTARLMLNAELSAGGQARFIVPHAYREDYLGAMRAMSIRSDPSAMIRMIERILGWVTRFDWRDLPSVRGSLERTNALLEKNEYDAGDLRLLDP